jgi:hypothetical protein
MSQATLALLLDDIMHHVLDGDSYEGSLEYLMPGPIPPGQDPNLWPATDAEFWVTAAYRIGNLQGQGGMRLIGTVPS